MKCNPRFLLKEFVVLVLLSVPGGVFSVGRASACDQPVAPTESCGEAICGIHEVRLTGRLVLHEDGSLRLQTTAKGQADGPVYVLRTADESVNDIVVKLLEQAEGNDVQVAVVGSFDEDSVFVVTAVVSGARSGVSIGSQ
jgi:hypothetical protein